MNVRQFWNVAIQRTLVIWFSVVLVITFPLWIIPYIIKENG